MANYDKYEKAWESGKTVRVEWVKVLVGTIFVFCLCYLIYTFFIVPLGMIYKLNDVVQMVITAVFGIFGEIAVFLVSRKKYGVAEQDFDMGIGGLNEKEEERINPIAALDSINTSITEIEYHLKRNNYEAARELHNDIIDRIKDIPNKKKEEISAKIADISGKLDELKKKLEDGRGQVENT